MKVNDSNSITLLSSSEKKKKKIFYHRFSLCHHHSTERVHTFLVCVSQAKSGESVKNELKSIKRFPDETFVFVCDEQLFEWTHRIDEWMNLYSWDEFGRGFRSDHHTTRRNKHDASERTVHIPQIHSPPLPLDYNVWIVRFNYTVLFVVLLRRRVINEWMNENEKSFYFPHACVCVCVRLYLCNVQCTSK